MTAKVKKILINTQIILNGSQIGKVINFKRSFIFQFLILSVQSTKRLYNR